MYLAGESYAGQYIPYFGPIIRECPDDLPANPISCAANAILSSDIVYPLRGVAIGNGWFDGRHQYPSYLEYAVRHGIVDPSTSVSLSPPPRERPLTFSCYLKLYKTLKAETDACMRGFNAIGGYEPTSVSLCENLVVRVLGGKATKWVVLSLRSVPSWEFIYSSDTTARICV
jgi:carboxypeptidase D